MRIEVALSVVATASVLSTVPAAAQNSAFCLRGCDFGYSNCSFSSYQQCQASTSGLTAWWRLIPISIK
jgi:hypothetical protein